MTERPTLDVSGLPPAALDARSPGWWGNTLLMVIETTTVALLAASYLYLWRNFPQPLWPPPQVDREPAVLDPVPDLLFGTLNTVLLLASCGLMAWVDRRARQQFARLEELGVASPSEASEPARPPERPTAVLAGLGGLVVVGVAAIILRFYEFPGLEVSWDDNAYGSLVWSMLGLHLTYLVVALVEVALAAGWIGLYGLDQNLAIDVTLTAPYWHWTVGVWVVLYGLVYWFPRVA